MGIESNQEFDDFVASGEVEVGDANAGAEEGADKGEKKPAAKRGPPKPAPAAKEPAKAPAGDDDDHEYDGDEDSGEGEGEGDGDDEGGEEKPKRSARESQIDRLKREKAQLARELREARAGGNADLTRRLENLEKGLPAGKGDDTKTAGTPAPDPTDTAKYPLGHLDDRYIEDKLEWLADQKATKQADAVLQRQQENERHDAASQQHAVLLDQVDDLSAKGSELFEDFQESVVEAGMRGDWKLSQPTFEAAYEVDNGAQILYDLSQDRKEALRVSRLSPYQQMKFVQERDAEIGTGKKGRTKPKAGEPPKNTPRGANSRTHINPATDNLDDFEKAWEQDAKKSN